MFDLSCFGGSSYLNPGRIWRTDDCVKSIRFTASRMIPSEPTRMILLCFAMISTHNVKVTASPISFVPARSMNTTRSSPSWRMSVMTEPVRCFLSSIQSIGGVDGFSGAPLIR